jgi:undecaprenyl-diphosphatase
LKRNIDWQPVISSIPATLAFWALAGLLFAVDSQSDYSSPVATFVMKLFSRGGDTVTMVGLCVLLIIIPRSRHTIALSVCVTVAVSSAVYIILKISFTTQPVTFTQIFMASHNAFPSGHAINNAALYTMLTIQTNVYIRNARRKVLLSAAFMLLAMAIGYCRVYLGFHSSVDVLGGWIIGFVLAFLVYLLCPRPLRQ